MELQWNSPIIQIAFALLLAVLSITITEIPVMWKCVLWGFSWAVILHFAHSFIPGIGKLPLIVKGCLAVGLTAFLIAGTYSPIFDLWKEEKANAPKGHLRALRDGRKYDSIVFQIGPNAKAWFTWTGEPNNMMWGNLGSRIRLRRNDSGDLVTDTVIKDRQGHMIVEITENDWRVSNASWEKNYTDDSLEVRDARGKIIFQIRLLPDRAEFQAEWWDENGDGMRVVQMKDKPDSPDSDKKGFVIVKMTPTFHPDEPEIQPIFRYPATKHFGEFKQ